jgi:hypothetical protein
MKFRSLAVLCNGVAMLAAGWLPTAHAQSLSPNASVFVTGLNNPRGLKLGPNGDLYVAEGGVGGATSTEGECGQVVPPIGPYTGGFNSRISKIDQMGVRTTVTDQLPSSQTSPGSGAFVSGVSMSNLLVLLSMLS